MKKKFTFNIPDEMWVDNFSKNLTMDSTYEGPETLYVLVSGENVISWKENPYEHYNRDTCKVVELNASVHPDIAYLLAVPVLETMFEDATNPDGSVYQVVSNPTMHSYYNLKYDESNTDNPWRLDLIVRNRNIPEEARVMSELKIAENYKQSATFDSETTTLLDKYISDAKQYLAEIKSYYPWRYVEFNPPKGPKTPSKLLEAFKNIITE